MNLFSVAIFCLAVLALSTAGPTRRYKFTRGNSGTSGRAGGDETSVDTESKVQAGDESGIFAETRGVGSASGAEESSLDLESWAGFEGWQTGGAGGNGRAIGDETFVDTDSEVFIGEETGVAKSGSRGGARGVGESAIDLESFGSLDGWSSGSAGGGGKALGDETEIESDSSVNTEFGRGTLSRSGSRGAAASDRLARVNLENFAGVDETNTNGKASALAIGNRASGRSGASSLHGADGEILVGSESEAESEARGRGGVRTVAEADDNGFGVRAGSEGRGEGERVITGGRSKTGLSNTKAAGQSSSFSRSSGRGSSFAESGASIVIGGEKPVQPAPQDRVPETVDAQAAQGVPQNQEAVVAAESQAEAEAQ